MTGPVPLIEVLKDFVTGCVDSRDGMCNDEYMSNTDTYNNPMRATKVQAGTYYVLTECEATGSHFFLIDRRPDGQWMVEHTGLASGMRGDVVLDKEYCGDINETKRGALEAIEDMIASNFYIDGGVDEALKGSARTETERMLEVYNG